MLLSIIVAAAENNAIGKKGEIPWYLPADLKHFAQITKGHSVIMGRKTYDSIIEKLGKPLPERKNIIITRQENFVAPGACVVSSLSAALSQADSKEVFILGGAEIYSLALPQTQKIYLTRVHTTFDADTFFPTFDEKEWRLTSSEKHEADEKNKFDYTFQEYERATV